MSRYDAIRRYPLHEQEGLLEPTSEPQKVAAPMRTPVPVLDKRSPTPGPSLGAPPPHVACTAQLEGFLSEKNDAASAEARSAQGVISALGEQTTAELDATTERLTTAALDAHVSAGARRIAEVIDAVSHDKSVCEIVLSDYLEEFAKFIAGRGGAHAFLQCVGQQLASCKRADPISSVLS